ncbi:UBP-type zinc finger domain-containing protein [Streptomyces sp. NBC_00820]|uniref:UBP-type zinc finger domain-containing protein n=1 Tax=Streptomyces sp. NBC_00820 TaxID=2975842 RepID=UPI002ED1826F|nr:UBP-type zinc finger domain-containing protein [Streptomyces sp. NBC_00820]
MSTWVLRPDGGRPEGRHCAHLDQPAPFPPPCGGCQECTAGNQRWIHLRMCLTCGHVGCCDSSPGAHATAHHEESGHPVAVSAEAGEEWAWCYVDEVFLRPR